MRYNTRGRASAGFVLLAATLCFEQLRAQESALPPEFQSIHDDLTKPNVILTIDQGRAALDQLTKLALNASALPTESRLKLLRAECLAHLAVGDAKNAAERAAGLAAEAAGAKEALETVWLAAIAAGDAKLADETARHLSRGADAESKRALTKRRRQLKAVARAPLPAQFATSEDRTIALGDRDEVVLLLDVWSLRSKPDKSLIEAQNKLKGDLAGQSNIDFLSINVDSQAKREDAQKFLADAGCTWPTAFAATAEGDADLVEALDAGLPGYQAVIDQGGHVRAVGDLREPALQYALRAAHAEARGDFAPVPPRTLDGKAAQPRASESDSADSADSGSTSGDTAAPPPAGKPSNPEAADLLRQVRLFRRTGNYTKAKELCREILEKYPGTHEAEEADFFLRSMP